MILALFALVCVGCGDKEDDPGTTVDQMKKDAGDKANESMDFACAKPGCTKTKSGTMADPPS